MKLGHLVNCLIRQLKGGDLNLDHLVRKLYNSKQEQKSKVTQFYDHINYDDRNMINVLKLLYFFPRRLCCSQCQDSYHASF